MQIPSTLIQVGYGLRQLPPPSQPQPPTEPARDRSVLKGIAGGVAGAVIDSVGLSGTTLRQTVPFQLKAQKDLWNSEHGLGYKIAWSAGLVGINAAAICLSPIIGAAVGAYYGYQAGSQQGIAAACRETAGVVGFVNTILGDTFRDKPRIESDSPAPTTEQVKVRFVTQDPSVTQPIVGEFPKSMLGDHLSNDRITVADTEPFVPTPKKSNPNVNADEQGNYLFDPGSAEFQQVQSFLSANLALGMYEKALGRKIPWAFAGPLQVHPHAGEGFNAFYARQIHSVNFFDGKDPVQDKTIHGSESLDVTSHEVGHAILDALKPGLMSWFSGIEGPSFHESFGDITAMLTALQQDSVIDQLVAETQGDLRKPNAVARLGEEMSVGINNAMLQGSMPADWVMRDANNDFKYQDPATLTQKPQSMDELFREPHSFSRIFTGAFWDVVCSVNQRFLHEGGDAKQALLKTRDAMTNLMARTLDLSPNRMKHLSQVAEAMVQADQRYGNGQFHQEIVQAMSGRNLLAAQLPPTTAGGKPSMGASFGDLSAADGWRKEQGSRLAGSDANLKAEAVWNNDQGETFVRYTGVQEVDLDPTTVTDLGASLTLGFDPSGQLFHTQWEPVDGESVQLAREEVQTWRDMGAIVGSSPSATLRDPGHSHGPAGRTPMGYALPVNRPGKSLRPVQKQKIVRVPSSSCYHAKHE